MKICNKKDDFDILNDISEISNLVQLMDPLVNVNRAISIVVIGYLNPTMKNNFV